MPIACAEDRARTIPRRCSSAASPCLARGDRGSANADFNKVLRLVPPGSDAAKRAEAGLRGEQPPAAAPAPPASQLSTKVRPSAVSGASTLM